MTVPLVQHSKTAGTIANHDICLSSIQRRASNRQGRPPKARPASECPDVKNYKWRLNAVCHKMLYSCTMATV